MLLPRLLSALVMIPLALAMVHFGDPWFDLGVALIAALMAWEWQGMIAKVFDSTGYVMAGVAVCAALLVGVDPVVALLFALLGPILVHAIARRSRHAPLAWWLGLGTYYVAIPALTLVWLRGAYGETVMYWLFLVVWGTDIGAYIAGRLIGGPLLMPKISPKKTWAGLIGGMVAAAALAGLTANWMASPAVVELAVLGAILAVVAQAGDFLESGVKRRFQVKDSSNLIPGHGGVLDRVDGLIAAAPVLAAVVYFMDDGFFVWSGFLI